jgi:hypothetical protein
MPYLRQVAFGEAAKILKAESASVPPDVLFWFVKNTMQINWEASEHRTEFFQTVLSDPGIDPWISHIVGGFFYKALAWQFRGEGWASDVPPDAMAKFLEYIAKAAEHFRRAWYLHPELPDSSLAMISVSMAGASAGWTLEDWFHAALFAQADYNDIYSSYFYACTPRWGGSQRKIAAVAEECIATDRWDLGIPNQVGWALQNLELDDAPNDLIGQHPYAARLAKRYIESFFAAHQRGEVKSKDHANRLAEMTAILVTTGDYETARKALEVSPQNNGWYWGGDRRVPYRYSEALSYAMTGPARAEVQLVHEFLTRPAVIAPTVAEVETLQKKLDEARQKESEEKSKLFFDLAGKMLKQLQTYAAGDWVDLTFEPGLNMWVFRCWNSEIIDEKTIKLVGDSSIGGVQLKPLTRFAPPFIVEAEVKPISVLSGHGSSGITIGADRCSATHLRPSRLSIMVEEAIIGYLGGRGKPGRTNVVHFELDPMPEDGFRHLGLRRYEGETEFFAMHNRIAVDRDQEEPMTDHVSFGDVVNQTMSKEIIFRNLRIRKLPPKPKAAALDHPDSLANARAFVEFYPECPEARTRLAMVLTIQGRPDEALQHLEAAEKVSPKIFELHRVRGTAFSSLGRFREATEAFRLETEMFAAAPWARIHLAWVLATAPDVAVRNGSLAESLLTATPLDFTNVHQSWSFLLTQAAVAAELGDFENAKRLVIESEEATASDRQKEFTARVRQAIDEKRPYRMPITGELPPEPAAPRRLNEKQSAA